MQQQPILGHGSCQAQLPTPRAAAGACLRVRTGAEPPQQVPRPAPAHRVMRVMAAWFVVMVWSSWKTWKHSPMVGLAAAGIQGRRGEASRQGQQGGAVHMGVPLAARRPAAHCTRAHTGSAGREQLVDGCSASAPPRIQESSNSLISASPTSSSRQTGLPSSSMPAASSLQAGKETQQPLSSPWHHLGCWLLLMHHSARRNRAACAQQARGRQRGSGRRRQARRQRAPCLSVESRTQPFRWADSSTLGSRLQYVRCSAVEALRANSRLWRRSRLCRLMRPLPAPARCRGRQQGAWGAANASLMQGWWLGCTGWGDWPEQGGRFSGAPPASRAAAPPDRVAAAQPPAP